jgi:lysozyme
MLLMLDYGIFYEFIPMDKFDRNNLQAIPLAEVELGKNYAVVISTNGGLWRYLIGDTSYDGKTLSDAEIDALFAADVKWAEDIINGLGLPLKQNQFDALVSFVYNVGPGKKGVKDGLITLRNGNPSSVLRNMRAGNIRAAGDSMLSWTRSAGKVMSGLVKRRQAERALLLGA